MRVSVNGQRLKCLDVYLSGFLAALICLILRPLPSLTGIWWASGQGCVGLAEFP